MKKYLIYSKPEAVPQIVSIGWSLSAFLFVGFWAIFNKLYRLGFGIMIFFVFIHIVIDSLEINHDISELIEIICCGPIHIFFGYRGNRWIEQNFIKQGYQLHDTVESDSHQEALSLLSFKLDFFDKE